MGRVSGLAFGVWRFFCASLIVASGAHGAGVIVYVMCEAWMSASSCVNAIQAERVDNRWIGLGVPLLYCVGMFVQPTTNPGFGADLLLLIFCVPRISALVYLGLGSTCGCSTFWRLADRGPYRWVRHPLQLSGLLARAGICFAFPSLWNVFGFWVMVAASVGIVVLEESFLRGVEVWREYAIRVRWRLLPGVW